MGGEAPLKQRISEHPLPAQRERHSVQVIALSHHRNGRLVYLLASWLLVWVFLLCFVLLEGRRDCIAVNKSHLPFPVQLQKDQTIATVLQVEQTWRATKGRFSRHT